MRLNFQLNRPKNTVKYVEKKRLYNSICNWCIYYNWFNWSNQF